MTFSGIASGWRLAAKAGKEVLKWMGCMKDQDMLRSG
jgi:hypothetical protein